VGRSDGRADRSIKKLGAFYVEFIFHAWVVRDFFVFPATRVWKGSGKCGSGFCPKLLFLSWTFFFEKKNEKRKHIEFFLLPKCPPTHSAATITRSPSTLYLFFSSLFVMDKNEKKTFFRSSFVFFFFFMENCDKGCELGGLERWLICSKNEKKLEIVLSAFFAFFFFLPFLIGFFLRCAQFLE
jgi:hypothetical protein